MTAISKTWVTIADGQVDPDSPLDAALMGGLRDDLVHLREWLGASYFAGAAQNHSHDGVDSALVPIGASAIRNGSFESGLVSWTTAEFTGGTVAVNAANAMDGANCLAFTSTVLANGGGTATSNEFIPAAAGMSYSLRAIVKGSVANISSRMEAIWYDSAQTQISASNAYDSTNTPTVQTEVGTDLVAPANTRYYKIRFTGGVAGAGSATGTIYADQTFAQKPVGGLIRFTTITATDAAWAPLAATRRIVVCCAGGGSGGGGGGSATAGEGGHAGTTAWGSTASIAATFAATIGAGSAGAAAANDSTQGGTTSFGAVASAVGGLPARRSDISVATYGISGETGIGIGGASTTGNGGAAAANSAAGGASGTGGAGAGGAGGSGIIYVWEFA